MQYIIKNIDNFDDNFYDYIYMKLSNNEKSKIDKLINKKNSLLGYYELYLLLKTRNINLFEQKIKYNKFNKPYIDNIYFNISHDYKITVCAISNKEVGIDIVYLNRNNINIDKKEFAIKEAYLKMIGSTILNINMISLDIIYNSCIIKEIVYNDYLIVICEKNI